jgi:hypothetical protein
MVTVSSSGGFAVPANRSRTAGWRRCLQQVHERSGAVEIAVARHYDDETAGRHLVWRVRVLDVNDGDILVEQPVALGRAIEFEPGIELVVVLSIGQNRWMFTSTLQRVESVTQHRRTVHGLRLPLPAHVKRCQRRSHYRIETTAITLPQVTMWPLLDPQSVVLAERRNELEYERAIAEAEGRHSPHDDLIDQTDTLRPELGPQFTAQLMNIGGGGAGLRIEAEHDQCVARHKQFWMSIDLQPELPVPICASARLVHTHLESTQDVYAGMAFDFSFNPSHESFVAGQILRYIAMQQRAMLDEDETPARKSA